MHLSAALSRQHTLYALLLHILHTGNELAVAHQLLGLQLSIETNGERECSLFVGLDAYNDGIVGLRGKNGAGVAYTFIYIRGRSEGIAQIQFTLVTFHLLVTKVQLDVSHGQITHTVRSFNKILVNQRSCISLTSFENETLHLGQMFQ